MSDPGLLEQFIVRLYQEAAQGNYGLRPFGQSLIADEPEIVEAICSSPDGFHKDYDYLAPFGSSRLSTNGEEWRLRRQASQEFYQALSRPANRPQIAKIFAEWLAACDCSNAQNVAKALLGASLTVFHRGFGVFVPSIPQVMEFIEAVRATLRNLQLLAIFGGSVEQGQESTTRAKALVSLLTHRSQSDSILAHIFSQLSARAGGVPGFSPTEEYIMNLIAGVETSVAAMSWVLDRIGLYPHLQEELSAEVRSGTDCPRTESFVDEVLRRFPPVPLVSRQATKTTRIGSTELRAGQRVLISIVGVHHHPDYWAAPNRFDPDRFLKGKFQRRAFIPFLVGPRSCAGAQLARMEIAEGVKALLSMFQVERLGRAIRFEYAMAARPTAWELVRVARRQS